METYPTITKIIQDVPIIAFDKLDGNNIRVEWNWKRGFTKYGTRKRLLDPNEQPFGQAVSLFQNKYADDLDKIFKKQRWEKATAFFELYGPNSFSGFHQDGDELDVTLLDVHVYKKGMLQPREFLKLFENRVEIPNILYEGKANDDFVREVQEGTLEGMTFEGVVCKGGLDRHNRPTMFKIKNRAWLQRLREHCAGNDKMFEQLA